MRQSVSPETGLIFRPTWRLNATLALAILLAGCNSTEVMTPRAEVGDGSQTGGYTQSTGQYTAAAPTQPVQSAPLSSGGYEPPMRGPQNTLEAQAAALAQGGQNPAASRPLDNAAYQEFPEAPQSDSNQVSQQQQQPQQPARAQQQQQASLPPSGGAQAAGGTIRFLPIIGAPVQAVTPLSRQLGAEARARGLTIKSANDANSEHILKGYFSAFSDSGKVTITYVWDVLDAAGGRLHRIQGQETVPSGAKDPWAAVPASVMQQIATKSMTEYMQWRNAQSG